MRKMVGMGGLIKGIKSRIAVSLRKKRERIYQSSSRRAICQTSNQVKAKNFITQSVYKTGKGLNEENLG